MEDYGSDLDDDQRFLDMMYQGKVQELEHLKATGAILSYEIQKTNSGLSITIVPTPHMESIAVTFKVGEGE